jgi:hypothetical protein
MPIITVLNDGHPWLICMPADNQDLQSFLSVSSVYATGAGFTHRQATPGEAAKWSAACALHVRNGGNADSFFGIPA